MTMVDKKTPAGATRTGVERRREGAVGGSREGEEPTLPRLEVETESQPPVGGAKRTTGNPADSGDRTDVPIERRDSVRELGSEED